MSQVQIKSLKETHHKMIDWLLVNQAEKYSVLASNMGVTRSWLSIVMHSDVFVEEYTRRRLVQNKELGRQLIERQFSVALKAYDKLEVILDDDEVEDRLVLDAADKTAKALGFSPSAGNSPRVISEATEVVTETSREVRPGVIERARERLRHVQTTEYPRALPSPEG